ncbi:MAG: bifunctional UDP-N-acetylmuramoyl-L-alanyl-D-glutamate--2,6-diaminopimelate ligase MurE/UDP-N-acetylmuramoyl-tripeptide--D-alanyl-D-alanine ligase MurF [Kofleriaceae bacterium]
MTLRDLIDGLTGARVVGDANVEVRAVRSDSREIAAGDVFVAVRGLRSDGHAFIATALEQGAAAVVVETEPEPAVTGKVPVVVVPSGAVALGVMVGRSLGNPAAAMTLIGITGTNGKTTTTYLVESILTAAGAKPGVIGTVSYRWGGQTFEAPYTTPTPAVLHETFAKMRDAGCTHVVMEVSSAALSMERLAGVKFAVSAFSNLTQDHLDIHGTMTAYRDAKRKLFSAHTSGTSVINIDDPEGPGMATVAPGRVVHVSGQHRVAEVSVLSNESTVRGITAMIATPRGELAVESKPLIGHYNVANIALAVAIGEALELPHDAIARGVAALAGVPGRVERVVNQADLDIFVDYAHTPDALRNVLAALRPLTKRRLICVFGCGGDRDPNKRPKMGAAVSDLADLAVVTSDNPRTEDPRAIIDQILPGVPRPFLVDPDRRTAIRAAVSEATPGDVVVIAGKGHEDYQIIGTTKHHFDDREQAAEAILDRWRRSVAALGDDLKAAGTGAMIEPGDDPNAYVTRVVIDSRIAAPGDLFVAIRGANHDGHAFMQTAIEAGARALLVDSEGRGRVSQPHITSDAASLPRASTIVVRDTRLALGAIAHAHRHRWSGKLVAVTGSAGKTTTKELIKSALATAGTIHASEGSFNNETGVPLTLLGLREFHQFAVIEMGMRGPHQIEYLTKMAEPDVAVVINAGTAHIELLGSTDAIAKAKSEIWIGLRDNGTIVRPIDDDRLERWARSHRPRARHVTFGELECDVRLVEYAPLDAGGTLVIDVFGQRHALELSLAGRHAAIDACAAIAAAHAAGASIEQALAGVRRARPPAMRGELVEVAGRKVIVDCYNANPASMTAALRSIHERARGRQAFAIVGDMLELGNHAPAAHRDVGALARELAVKVIALGDHATTVVEAAGPASEVVDSPATAAAHVLERTTPGDWILLKGSRGMRLERVLEAMKAAT